MLFMVQANSDVNLVSCYHDYNLIIQKLLFVIK